MKQKLLSSFIISLTLSSGLIAQNIWGVGAASVVGDATFSNAFVNSTTAGSYSPTTWTALSI